MFGPTIAIKYELPCWVDSTNFPVGARISWRGWNKLQDNKISPQIYDCNINKYQALLPFLLLFLSTEGISSDL